MKDSWQTKIYVTESVSLTATPQAVRRLRHEQLRPEGCLRCTLAAYDCSGTTARLHKLMMNTR
jgi:hypothetical protein